MSLVSKNYEIERAIVQMENEVAQMKQQQGDENKENIRQDFWKMITDFAKANDHQSVTLCFLMITLFRFPDEQGK